MVRLEIETQPDTPLSREVLDYLYKLTQSIDITAEQNRILEMLRKQYPKPFPRLIVIGRFQPVHLGHLHLIRCAQAVSQQVAIGIGSANVHDKNNPFSFDVRKQLIQRALERSGIAGSVSAITSLDDYPYDDNEWLRQVIMKVGRVDAVIGNNPRVNGIFNTAGYQVVEVPFVDRERLEGTTIRADMRNQGLLPS